MTANTGLSAKSWWIIIRLQDKWGSVYLNIQRFCIRFAALFIGASKWPLQIASSVRPYSCPYIRPPLFIFLKIAFRKRFFHVSYNVSAILSVCLPIFLSAFLCLSVFPSISTTIKIRYSLGHRDSPVYQNNLCQCYCAVQNCRTVCIILSRISCCQPLWGFI